MLRAIHPVSYHEKFVASGVYQEYDAPGFFSSSEYTERWSIHELPDGSQIIRVDEEWTVIDSREKAVLIDGTVLRSELTYSRVNLLVEVLKSTAGKFDRLEGRFYYGTVEGKPQQAKTSILFFGQHAEVMRQTGQRPAQWEMVELPEKYIIYPQSTLLIGLTISQFLSQTNKTNLHVVTWVDFLTEQYYEDKLFQLKLSDYPLPDDAPQISAATIEAATKTYIVKQIAFPSFTIWLDEYGIPVKADTYIQPNEYKPEPYRLLTLYARRPEPQTS
jgi:hypothetical protein